MDRFPPASLHAPASLAPYQATGRTTVSCRRHDGATLHLDCVCGDAGAVVPPGYSVVGVRVAYPDAVAASQRR
jgi:hypothetical protein